MTSAEGLRSISYVSPVLALLLSRNTTPVLRDTEGKRERAWARLFLAIGQ